MINRLQIIIFFFFSALLFFACNKQELKRPNILLIVADDMNYDTPGFLGGVAPDVTPNIDRFASECFSFGNAFATVSVCQPSRQSMLSGLLPQSYGSAGFFPMEEGTPTLPALLREAGYLTGNIHKLHHMLPLEAFNWSYNGKELGLNDPDGVVGRNPDGIAGALHKFINVADDEEKPFFMVVNSADPHRPFHGDRIRLGSWYWGNDEVEIPEPSRVYKPEEVTVPPTLPDIPGIREDLAKYASSVRRLDDTFGKCLKVLSELQKEETTLVIFVSDNGMPLPFAKFDCYYGSNRTPLLLRWPEFIQKPASENEHLVSLMDITPTVLELTGVTNPKPMDGKSLVPFLKNQTPENWRESIVFIRNEDIYYSDGIKNEVRHSPEFRENLESKGWEIRPDHPEKDTYSREKEMRTYYDGQFGYIYNNCFSENDIKPGELGAIVPYGDATANAMRRASSENISVRERYQFYLLRSNEELYDWSEDPGSLHNLANDPGYADVLAKARKGLLHWLKSNNDVLSDEYQYFIESKNKE